jgi:hypothetical protein
MQIAVEYAVFLGASDDATVQPDVAMSRLEELSEILRRLTPEERESFRLFVETTAEDCARVGQAGRSEFLLNLFDNLGLE